MNQNKNLRLFFFVKLVFFKKYFNFTNNLIHIDLKNSWNVFNNIVNCNSIFHFIINFLYFDIVNQLRKTTLNQS